MSQAAGRAPRPPVALAFVVAAGYWYTHQPGKAAPQSTALSITSSAGVLVVGDASARHHLAIQETFDCGRCVTFESSVQAFLHADAAAGLVQIRYTIPRGANAAYDAALGTHPARALALHDQLFTAATAGTGGTLLVTLDGKPLTQTDPIALADALESALAQ